MRVALCVLALLPRMAMAEGAGAALILEGPNGHECQISVDADGMIVTSCPIRGTSVQQLPPSPLPPSPPPPPPPPIGHFSRFISGGYNYNCAVGQNNKLSCSGAYGASNLNSALADYQVKCIEFSLSL